MFPQLWMRKALWDKPFISGESGGNHGIKGG